MCAAWGTYFKPAIPPSLLRQISPGGTHLENVLRESKTSPTFARSLFGRGSRRLTLMHLFKGN